MWSSLSDQAQGVYLCSDSDVNAMIAEVQALVQLASSSEESSLKKMAKEEGIVKETDINKKIDQEMKVLEHEKEKLKKEKKKAPKVPFHPGVEEEFTKAEPTVKEKKKMEKKKIKEQNIKKAEMGMAAKSND